MERHGQQACFTKLMQTTRTMQYLRMFKESLNECGNVPPRSDELAKTREKLRPAYADGAVVFGF